MSRQSGFRLAGGVTFAALLIAAGALPAAAQYYPAPRVYMHAPPPPPPEPGLSARDADAIVRSLGLEPVGRIFGRGPVLFVRAAGQEGSEVRVTLDRYSGRVMRIVRVDDGGPRIASVAPERAPVYGPYDDEDDAYAVEDMPPPAAGPQVITRGGDITGSVARDPYVARSAPGPVDPLVGVPREFRSQQARPAPAQPEQRTAARPPVPATRATPLPRPRPADAPAVAQKESAPTPAAKPEPPAIQPKAEPEKVPDAQGFD